MRWFLVVVVGTFFATPVAAQEQADDMDFGMEESEAEGEDASPLNARPLLGGVGFHFGINVETARRACTLGGHRFQRETPAMFRCSGTALPVPLDARTTLTFEDGRLREIDVVIPLPERNRGVVRWAERYRTLKRTLEDKYGASRPASIVAAGCLASDVSLARCVIDDRAHVSSHWHPSNGGHISIHWLTIPHFGPTLRVSYLSHFAHRDPPPPASLRQATSSYEHF